MVEHFTYLGSILSSNAKCGNAKASKIFVHMRSAVLSNPILSIPTKRTVYMATVLVVLFCGKDFDFVKANTHEVFDFLLQSLCA